jgi:hypothetical protein
MARLIHPPRVVWGDPDALPKALDVVFDGTDQAIIWHRVDDATEVTLLVELGYGGGAAPTSVEIVPMISYDGGVTEWQPTALEYVAGGVALFGHGQIRCPVAALGAGIVAMRWAIPPTPVPSGSWVALRCKRTGGAAANTLRVSMADSEA